MWLFSFSFHGQMLRIQTLGLNYQMQGSKNLYIHKNKPLCLCYSHEFNWLIISQAFGYTYVWGDESLFSICLRLTKDIYLGKQQKLKNIWGILESFPNMNKRYLWIDNDLICIFNCGLLNSTRIIYNVVFWHKRIYMGDNMIIVVLYHGQAIVMLPIALGVNHL